MDGAGESEILRLRCISHSLVQAQVQGKDKGEAQRSDEQEGEVKILQSMPQPPSKNAKKIRFSLEFIELHPRKPAEEAKGGGGRSRGKAWKGGS